LNPQLTRSYAQKMTEQAGQPVTTEEAREEIHRVVLEVARQFRSAYTFGSYMAADMENESVVFALEALARYDTSQPLKNFLCVHVKNRLQNLKRKHFFRSSAPCDCCSAFEDPVDPCPKWLSWDRRNRQRMNLAKTPVLDGDEATPVAAAGPEPPDEMASSELLGRIDRGLPQDLRGDFLRMKAGLQLPHDRRDAVRAAVLELVGDDLGG
jgi:DNA-directed RNA polymerase specialized sigma24 family protein